MAHTRQPLNPDLEFKSDPVSWTKVQEDNFEYPDSQALAKSISELRVHPTPVSHLPYRVKILFIQHSSSTGPCRTSDDWRLWRSNECPTTVVSQLLPSCSATWTMSLPRPNYDPRRVCINPFPNLDLHMGKYRRSVDVYIAGGLVRLFETLLHLSIWS